MPNRPLARDFREGPITDISLVIGFIAAVLIALFLIWGPRWFSGEKSVDVIKAQPNIETPTTGETK